MPLGSRMTNTVSNATHSTNCTMLIPVFISRDGYDVTVPVTKLLACGCKAACKSSCELGPPDGAFHSFMRPGIFIMRRNTPKSERDEKAWAKMATDKSFFCYPDSPQGIKGLIHVLQALQNAQREFQQLQWCHNILFGCLFPLPPRPPNTPFPLLKSYIAY